MKKVKFILPLLAFFFAVAAAFAVQPDTDDFDTWYKADPDSPGNCLSQTECTLTAGSMCGFTVRDASCAASIHYKP